MPGSAHHLSRCFYRPSVVGMMRPTNNRLNYLTSFHRNMFLNLVAKTSSRKTNQICALLTFVGLRGKWSSVIDDSKTAINCGGYQFDPVRMKADRFAGRGVISSPLLTSSTVLPQQPVGNIFTISLFACCRICQSYHLTFKPWIVGALLPTFTLCIKGPLRSKSN